MIPSRTTRVCLGAASLAGGVAVGVNAAVMPHGTVCDDLNQLGAFGTLCGLGLFASCIVAGSKQRRAKRLARIDPLDRPVLNWSKNDPATLRDLLAGGVIIQGRTGSGKSSGPGDTILRALLAIPRSGGLIRCAKPEDLQHAFSLFQQAGRLGDLLVFSADAECKLRFNLLDFTLSQGRGSIRDVVHTLTTIGETLGDSADSKSGEDGAFWEQGRDRLLHRAVSVLQMAGEPISGPNVQRFIMTAASAREEMADAAWQKRYHSTCMQRAHAKARTPMEDHEFAQDVDLWLSEYPAMADKTRSSIVAHVMNILSVFNGGLVRELLSTSTSFTPLNLLAGKWLVSDMPFTQEGRFINAALQYSLQRALLRREVKSGDSPVFIFCDEYQEATNSLDPIFLAQCRSHLAAMICLTQSVPGLYARFKGRTGKHQADALLSNFATQVFCSCDPLTAEYASKWLGDEKEILVGGSSSPREELLDELMGRSKFSGSFSEQYQPVLRPATLMHGLRTGGPANRRMVDAIIVRTDRPFSNGRHFLKATFRQH